MPPLRSDENGQAEGSRPLPTMWGDRGTKRKRTLTQGCGPGMPGPYGVALEGAVCFQHPAHVNVENTCNFYLIIIV